MTPENVEFVRDVAQMARICGQTKTIRLLSLLVKAETQARYWHHFAHAHSVDNPICNKRHTFNEFATQARKEWGI